MAGRFCRVSHGMMATTVLLLLALLMNVINVVEGTKITWKPNSNPDAPEAATAPRSQKYWDENNIERPDYAKTDMEVMQERLQKIGLGGSGSGSSSGDGGNEKTSLVSLILIVAFFVIMWVVIFRLGMGLDSGLGFLGIGKKEGVNRLGGSASLGGDRGGAVIGRWGGKTLDADEKARAARLARFEMKKDE